jgi:hypothetical protein
LSEQITVVSAERFDRRYFLMIALLFAMRATPTSNGDGDDQWQTFRNAATAAATATMNISFHTSARTRPTAKRSAEAPMT